jgi:hypothetical protein
MVILRGKPKKSEGNILQCHFILHDSHLKSPRIEVGCTLWEPSVYSPELSDGHCRLLLGV